MNNESVLAEFRKENKRMQWVYPEEVEMVCHFFFSALAAKDKEIAEAYERGRESMHGEYEDELIAREQKGRDMAVDYKEIAAAEKRGREEAEVKMARKFRHAQEMFLEGFAHPAKDCDLCQEKLSS